MRTIQFLLLAALFFFAPLHLVKADTYVPEGNLSQLECTPDEFKSELPPPCCCPNSQDERAKTLIITVHGINSTGTELDGAIAAFNSSPCLEVKKFTYNDRECTSTITKKLKTFVKGIRAEGNYCKIIIFAHSAGGIPASRLASDPEAAPLEVHTIATPLNGGDHGWLSNGLAAPFIGCLAGEIGGGVPKFKPPAAGTTVTHHKTKDKDDGVLPEGYQTGNDVPGSTSITHPGLCHICILEHVAQGLIPPCGDQTGSGGKGCALFSGENQFGL